MDLRSIINSEGGDSSSSSSIPKQATPVTPIQAPPSQSFREYNHPPQASPGKHVSQDYSSHAGGPYASPMAYQGAYQGRPPAPPPIQAPPQGDLRSPSRSYSAQSPYQHTPSTSSTNQYPFPQNQTPQSPAQHQQYPPSYQRGDSYPQQNPPPHLQPQNSYNQTSPTPQTPPVGMHGAPHLYLQHQRSQSSLSTPTPTPTSAQSQGQSQHYGQNVHDSPVSASHFPPSQTPQHQRQPSQQSQPGTPLGPPLTQRQSSGGFNQPQSPYQQRAPSGPFSNFQQTSPAPPPPVSLVRHQSTPSGYDSQRTSISDHQRRSQSERERSISVSPKTRLPSQPRTEIPASTSENGHSSSTKRKMDDRQLSSEDPRVTQYPIGNPPQVNGDHSRSSHSDTTSPQPPMKKRIRYTEPPIWAQSIKVKGALIGRSNRGPAKLNGKQTESHNAPMVKQEINGNHQGLAPRPDMVANADPSALLGPWDKSITGQPPLDQTAKAVADFLFSTVVSRDDLGELSSRGVDIEIEAKLGQLIDKDTNERLRLPVQTDCVIHESPRIHFRSSMTAPQHKTINDFLNKQVAETHQTNPHRRKAPPVSYSRRTETDRFYELPHSLIATLPAAVQGALNPQRIKVRVTTDQKTQQILAKIIKARIADLSIYNPRTGLDCRISVNFEIKFDGDIEEIMAHSQGEKAPDRHKNRLSYNQGPYQIDLTQVTQTVTQNGISRTEQEHELEIEVTTQSIREQGQRASHGQPNEYPTLVEGLLNNVFILSREVQ